MIDLDPDKTAIASGRDLRISPKATREICQAIRHMRLYEARNYLQDVIDMKRPVVYRHHKKKQAHRRGIQGFYAGRYPVKAASEIIKVLDSIEANAIFKGLDLERLKIIHAAAQRARKIKGYIPRAFGRASPRSNLLCHVELVVEEVE